MIKDKINVEREVKFLNECLPDGLGSSVEKIDITVPPDISTLNPHQKEFYDAAMSYVYGELDPDPCFVVLEGFAGSGKTFVTTKVLHQIAHLAATDPDFAGTAVGVCAPTHKAVNNLVNMSPFRLGDNCPISYSTLHKMLNVKKQENTETGEEIFAPDKWNKKPPAISTKDIVVLDEAGMTGNGLYKYFEEYVFRADPAVFAIGDPEQLPPVGQSGNAKFFDKDYRRRVECKVVTLETPMRQAAGSAILNYATNLRNGIYDDMDARESTMTDVDRNLFVPMTDDNVAFLMMKMIQSEEYMHDPNYMKIIAYTNKQCKMWADVLHKEMYGDSKYIFEGEILTLKEPSITQDEKGNEIIGIPNNTDVWVTNVKDSVQWVSGQSVDTLLLRVEYLDNSGNKIEDEIRTLPPHSQEIISEMINWNKSEAIKAKKKGQSPRQYWAEYFRLKKWATDVERSYVKTIHRSQGSTYGTSFVCQFDIDSLRYNAKEFKAMNYVASTRAKFNNIIIY